MLLKFLNDNRRLTTDFAMLVVSVLGVYLTAVYAPHNGFDENVAIGLGYVSLLLLAITLVIGPVNLLRKRRNPVNIDLRRDIGVWCGITTIIHVIYSIKISPGRPFINFFIGVSTQNGFPSFGTYEISNDLALVATLLMVLLLVTSNQISLKFLKGKRWKFLQRFTYLLTILAVIHTFIFQTLNMREGLFTSGLFFFSGVVVVAQLGGVMLHLFRDRQRKHNLISPGRFGRGS